jgi:HAD superfamily hydrolase (TIGR01509 family)
MLEALGVEPKGDLLDRYRTLQWELHRRDFALREGVVDTLKELRRRGLHVGLVSNIDDDQLTHLMELAGLAELFDSMLTSEQARSCKPDPAIFAEAVRRAGCDPDQALFVGDTLAQDVAGANRAGLRSVLLWHRDDRPPAPEPGAEPAHVIRNIPEVLELV